METATALLTGEAPLDAMGYLLAAVVDHAPREILPAAARLLGVDIPPGQGWSESGPADAALRAHAAADGEHAARVAVAIHWALAEKDAGAEHPAWRGGPGVLAYTDVLVASGYTETAGDAANRERYGARSAHEWTPDDDEDAGTEDDTEAVE